MELFRHLINTLDDFKRASDLAAFCYLEIKRVVHDETTFLGGYWRCPDDQDYDAASMSNPNLPRLTMLGISISRCVRPIDDFDHEEVRKTLERFDTEDLKPYYVPDLNDEGYNEAAIYWAILWGIGEGIASHPAEHGSMHRRQPLNCYGRDEVGVYLAPYDSLICDSLSEHGATRVPDGTLNENLRGIALCPRATFAGTDYPTIVTLEDLSDTVRNRTLRVGLCQLTAASISTVNGEDEGAFIDFHRLAGGLFDVRYHEARVDEIGELAVAALDEAIDAHCDIVIFPELVIAPPILEMLKRHLADPLRAKNNLCLVVAGSGRLGEARDNVCTLLDAYGEVIGTTHKFSKYLTFRRPELWEQLDHPGRTNTLVDIEGIGRVLVGICKDFASDGERHTLEIAHALNPQVVCVPAFSQSVETAFFLPLQELAERKHAIGFVCNLCAARKQYGQEEMAISCVGTFELRREPGRKLVSHIYPVTRPDGAEVACANTPGPCLRVATLTFDGSAEPLVEINLCPARVLHLTVT